MKKPEVSRVEIDSIKTIDPNIRYITIEGKEGQENKDLFWRVHGELANPDCEIIVPPTHCAVFIKDGVMQNVLEGGKYRVFETVKKGFLGFGKKVDAVVVDVIFMNKTVKLNNKWGTKQKIYGHDPITEIPVTIAGNGVYEVSIDNPVKFYLEIVGLMKLFDLDALKERLHVKLMSYIEPVIAKTMRELYLSYADIAMHKKELNDAILPNINEMFVNDAGLRVHSFTIDYLNIGDNEIMMIEKIIANQKRELKEKVEAAELAAKLEKMDEKAWERGLLLRQLQSADVDKYYDVLTKLAEIESRKPKDEKKVVVTEKIVCPKCGKPLAKGANFCPECGMKLTIEKRYCKHCGKELENGSNFCSFCGHKA